MTSVALPVNGPAAGKLPGLRISAKVTLSLPELLVIAPLNEPPGGTTTNVLVRYTTVVRSGLLMARPLELNEEVAPFNVISMGEEIPASGQEYLSTNVLLLGAEVGLSPSARESTEPKSTSMGALLLIVQVDGFKLSELLAYTFKNVEKCLTNDEPT